ncbi:MAG: ribosome recycling factor [Bacteroidetes bacterium]|nr:ribosome recycling factor [Bacteroidota bacterium]
MDLAATPRLDSSLCRLSTSRFVLQTAQSPFKTLLNDRFRTYSMRGMIKKDGLPEDMIKDAETKVQQMTDKMIAKVDEILATKEKEIMTV